jgi:NADH dehydrogenase [ubiquinone] 1 alpha subcomplex assembly factor 7
MAEGASEGAGDAIRRAILARGPLPFDEYMTLALYGPGGFYEQPPVGPRGDFVTSPHVHPVFGTLVAEAVRRLAADLGDPAPLRIAEVGAGDGTLAGQVLDGLRDLDVTYAAVEVSPGGRERLGALDGVRVAEALDGPADVVLTNELLDNLPFRRIRGDREIRVGLIGERLAEVEAPWDGEPAPPGQERIVPVGSRAFVAALAEVLVPGYALLIDYGAVGSTGGDVHGYREHHLVEDPLDAPGLADITVGVDFADVARTAREHGLAAHGPVSQRAALTALGYERWARAELRRQGRLLDQREGIEAVRAWSGRSAASLLVDPAALGRLRWIVLASDGLPAPGWLNADD